MVKIYSYIKKIQMKQLWVYNMFSLENPIFKQLLCSHILLYADVSSYDTVNDIDFMTGILPSPLMSILSKTMLAKSSADIS